MTERGESKVGRSKRAMSVCVEKRREKRKDSREEEKQKEKGSLLEKLRRSSATIADSLKRRLSLQQQSETEQAKQEGQSEQEHKIEGQEVTGEEVDDVRDTRTKFARRKSTVGVFRGEKEEMPGG